MVVVVVELLVQTVHQLLEVTVAVAAALVVQQVVVAVAAQVVQQLQYMVLCNNKCHFITLALTQPLE
jgi:hypothetical protein